MKKIFFLIAFAFISTKSFSQTFTQAANFIKNNAGSESFEYQVLFSEKNNLIYILEKHQWFNSTTRHVSAKAFDPSKVSSISLKRSKTGYNVKLQFDEDGARLKFAQENLQNQGTFYTLENVEKLNLSDGPKYISHTIICGGCNDEKATKVKNAFIHLFKTLGYSIEDEDTWF